MNLMLILFLSLLLTGLLVAVGMMRRSLPEGYEDDAGFHFGRARRRAPPRTARIVRG